MQTTDENVTPVLILGGPELQSLEVNASFGALGPGWRGNACIGRALRLVMNNIGGGWPGAVSVAGLGQPARYTLCFAEDEALQPLGAASRGARVRRVGHGAHGVARGERGERHRRSRRSGLGDGIRHVGVFHGLRRQGHGDPVAVHRAGAGDSRA